MLAALLGFAQFVLDDSAHEVVAQAALSCFDDFGLV